MRLLFFLEPLRLIFYFETCECEPKFLNSFILKFYEGVGNCKRATATFSSSLEANFFDVIVGKLFGYIPPPLSYKKSNESFFYIVGTVLL